MTHQPVNTAPNHPKEMGGRKHWSEKRLVVIRPDVPGNRFDPEDSVVLRTDQERHIAEVVLDTLYDEVQARKGKPPDWYELLDTAPDQSPPDIQR